MLDPQALAADGHRQPPAGGETLRRAGYTLSVTNTDPVKTMYFPKFDWPRIDNPKLMFPLTPANLADAEQREKAGQKGQAEGGGRHGVGEVGTAQGSTGCEARCSVPRWFARARQVIFHALASRAPFRPILFSARIAPRG